MCVLVTCEETYSKHFPSHNINIIKSAHIISVLCALYNNVEHVSQLTYDCTVFFP